MGEKFISVRSIKKKLYYIFRTYGTSESMKKYILKAIDKVPDEDVIKPMRCKECKYYDHSEFCKNRMGLASMVKPDDFCSYGKRKETNNG